MDKRILLVEDEEMIREMYKLAITQAGYQVDPVEDGETALLKLTNSDTQYDLVLLDIMLPKLDGISVLKELKQSGSSSINVPVFLLTNLGLEDLVKEALSLGAAQYFIKSNVLPRQIVEEINSFFQSNADAPSSSPPATTEPQSSPPEQPASPPSQPATPTEPTPSQPTNPQTTATPDPSLQNS